jgi:predicted MFS family arabinose efflux permease
LPSGTGSAPGRRLAILAVSCVFLGNGAVVGAWAVRIAEVQRSHGLSEAGLGAALVCVGIGALLSMPPTGVLATRFGSAACIRGLIVLVALAPAIAAASGSIPLLLVGLVALGAANGGLDVSMSTQAVAVERMLGRPMMSTLHALYSGGYLLSALVGGLVANAGVGVETHLVIVGAIAASAVLVTSRWLIFDRPVGVRTGFVRPSRKLLLLGVIAFGALFTEGSITDWGSVYVRHVLEGSAAVAGAALAAFGGGMAVSRLTGDHLRSRFGAVALMAVGAILAGTALAVALALSSPAATIVALLICGFGLGNCFPVALAAAGFVKSEGGVASSVASVATIGYTGYLMGPALIGLLTTALSLPGALCSLLVAMGVVLLLARQVGVADHA